MTFLEFLSALFGWIYTLSWSLSFYSQPMLNIRRKSTSGTTVDFPFINTLGFLTYLIYNAVFYSSPVIRYQYALRNHDHTPTVAVNDIVFAAHAFVVCTILTSQYFVPSIWGFDHAPGTKPSRLILGVMSGSIIAVAIIIFVVASVPPDANPKTSWAWLDVIYTLSYVKLLITLVKYAPQLVYNFRQRSTKGWSIWQILLDFLGGMLSIAQLVIDSWLQGDWSGITGNPVKFALGNVSMLYDLVFMTQHYVLYRDDGTTKDGERDSLLERGEDNRRLD
ncbi:PQ loop repeat-domain-containing protein [Annulohypoxylon truncatum]|uniref:PQ loop repeat-domain-containing protein n=1 Tax=Annulohypoxylon truncatum TaxID=327061 RepID=UPI00200777C9|nr:PQ loop repeat-domain-containing protein [Annulohypoxylon truncatum]KAI1215020.1 PQ loop repeat-domain-containing protein [Annulohypoxylon truncatum]